MAKMDTVYFAEDGSGKWFPDRSECERYEKSVEVLDWVYSCGPFKDGTTTAREVVERISMKYEVKQRWDWKEPETEVPASDQTPVALEVEPTPPLDIEL